MFTLSKEIEMKIPTDAGIKKAVVRWPEDEAWSARNRERKIFLRGGSVERIESEQADAALFAKVKVADSAELDEAEAGEVVDRLATAEVIDVALTEGQAEVTLRTCQGETKHVLKIPSIRDKKRAQQASVRMKDMPYGVRLLVTFLEPMASLYDNLKVSAEPYEGGRVPILHKDAAVRGVVEAVDRAITGDSENFQ